jgi:hypothetical protein
MMLPKTTTTQTDGYMFDAVCRRKPFSAVRCGDGEFGVMKWPDIDTVKERFKRWIPNDLSESEMRDIREQMIDAFKNADMVGIPSEREENFYLKWRGFSDEFTKMVNPKGKIFFPFYDTNTMHVHHNSYKRMGHQTLECFCIACRDVGKAMEKRFEMHRVESYLIPGERFLWKGKDAGMEQENQRYATKPHYPDCFNEIKEWIGKRAPGGMLFLIGAGGFGKIYCNWVKQAGGVAIDIGSLFDAWAGLATRPYFAEEIKNFKL